MSRPLLFQKKGLNKAIECLIHPGGYGKGERIEKERDDVQRVVNKIGTHWLAGCRCGNSGRRGNFCVISGRSSLQLVDSLSKKCGIK